MKIPSKVISYKESSISKYARTLQRLETKDYTPLDLFMDIKDVYQNIDEYIDVLDGLYALRAIEFNEERGLISYVERDI